MTEPRAERCENCRFYYEEGCIRFPPVIDAIAPEIASHFPSVEWNLWCGEYQPEREKDHPAMAVVEAAKVWWNEYPRVTAGGALALAEVVEEFLEGEGEL